MKFSKNAAVTEYKSEFESTKDIPYTGELWSVFSEYFEENWPRYNGTTQ